MMRMNCRVISVALLTTMLAGGPQIARAGFEWTPPPAPTEPSGDSALPALTPEMPAMPAAEVDSATLGQQPAPVPMPPLQSVPAIEPEPVNHIGRTKPPMPAEMKSALQSQNDPAVQPPGMIPPAAIPPQMMTPASPIPASPSSASYAEAVGFGADMPLAFAMRQIVPPEYAFAFDPSVDHGARVSWTGGKPWDMVLTETLLPLGLASVIEGKTVRVVPIGSASPQMPVMAAIPAPVYQDSVAMAPPMNMVSSPMPMKTITAPVAEPAPVHEVYIRRKGTEEKNEKSFWSHFGFGGGDRDGWKKPQSQPVEPMTAAPVQEPVPLVSASEPMMMLDNAEDQHAPVPLVSQKISYAEDTSYTSAPAAQPIPQAMAASPIMEPVPVMQAVEPVVQPVSVPAFVPPEPAAQADEAIAAPELPVDLYEIRYWQGEEGDSLQNVLSTWSKSANVELYWGPDEDYVLPEPVRLHGSYTDAVTRLLSLYEEKRDRPLGRLHPNLPQGPSVLVVEQFHS